MYVSAANTQRARWAFLQLRRMWSAEPLKAQMLETQQSVDGWEGQSRTDQSRESHRTACTAAALVTSLIVAFYTGLQTEVLAWPPCEMLAQTSTWCGSTLSLFVSRLWTPELWKKKTQLFSMPRTLERSFALLDQLSTSLTLHTLVRFK